MIPIIHNPPCHYKDIAQLFRYPDELLKNSSAKIKILITENYPEEKESFDYFLNFIESINQKELEELYIRTFDVQAICYLDIGYVLFGEDYKRGAFLVKMNEEQQKCGNDCEKELADHLPNVLMLLSVHPDFNFIKEFVIEIFYPAILKMIETFKDSQNPYKYLLQTLKFILKKDFSIEEARILESVQSSDNSANCSQCHCTI